MSQDTVNPPASRMSEQFCEELQNQSVEELVAVVEEGDVPEEALRTLWGRARKVLSDLRRFSIGGEEATLRCWLEIVEGLSARGVYPQERWVRGLLEEWRHRRDDIEDAAPWLKRMTVLQTQIGPAFLRAEGLLSEADLRAFYQDGLYLLPRMVRGFDEEAEVPLFAHAAAGEALWQDILDPDVHREGHLTTIALLPDRALEHASIRETIGQRLIGWSFAGVTEAEAGRHVIGALVEAAEDGELHAYFLETVEAAPRLAVHILEAGGERLERAGVRRQDLATLLQEASASERETVIRVLGRWGRRSRRVGQGGAARLQ